MWFLVLDRFKRHNHLLYIFHFFTAVFIIIPIFIVLYYSFVPANTLLKDNFTYISTDIFSAILRSTFVSILTIFFVFILGYPFAYLVSSMKSKSIKSLMILLISSPLWSSYFVKLLGLKNFFDVINGYMNSTSGLFYVIVGLIYLNLPIAILSFYNSLTVMSKNLINASLDLGSNGFQTMWEIVIPYTKDSLISTIFLVFIPSFSAVTAADFLNSGLGDKLIGQMMQNYVRVDNSASIAKSRISTLTLLVASLIFIFYAVFRYSPIVWKKSKNLYPKIKPWLLDSINKVSNKLNV